MKWSFKKILINWWKTPPEDAHKPVKTDRILPRCSRGVGRLEEVPPCRPATRLASSDQPPGARLPRRDLPRCGHSRDGARTRSAPGDHVPAASAHLHTGTALYRWLQHKVAFLLSPALTAPWLCQRWTLPRPTRPCGCRLWWCRSTGSGASTPPSTASTPASSPSTASGGRQIYAHMPIRTIDFCKIYTLSCANLHMPISYRSWQVSTVEWKK